MQTRSSQLWNARSARNAFSLVELLTAVSIMVVIIYALYAMFARTQQALRANVTQVDVLESGRSTAEMIGRELEQLTPCNLPQTVNLSISMTPTNLPTYQYRTGPVLQADLDGTPLRMNVLEQLFFLRRDSNTWVGTGFRVMPPVIGQNSAGGALYLTNSTVGTLYRYTSSTNYNYLNLNYTDWLHQFETMPPVNPLTGLASPNLVPLADGVVHFRVTAYDPDGRRLGWETTNMPAAYRILRPPSRSAFSTPLTTAANAQVILQPGWVATETQAVFLSNAVPAYVEFELGVLEPVALKQYQSMIGGGASPAVAQAFLSKQAGKVHLFRQRIPIRSVQP
jgi:hypothetical protein